MSHQENPVKNKPKSPEQKVHSFSPDMDMTKATTQCENHIYFKKNESEVGCRACPSAWIVGDSEHYLKELNK